MGTGAQETGYDDDFERLRVAAVERLDLLDTPGEERFDRITRIARELFDVPVAEINLIDDQRQFTKSPQRPGKPAAIARIDSFCEITVQRPEMVVVPDATEDERFAHRSPVTDERHVRFYAGRPLSLGDDLRVGTLCLVDTVPRAFGAEQQRLLDELGRWAERELQDTADLDRAAEVQQGLLPQLQPGWPEYEIAGICLPARAVGGDYYAWHGDGDGGGDGAPSPAGTSSMIELTLADVMGKGAAGAILAAAVRAAFQSRTGAAVDDAVTAVNAQLADDLGGSGSFATLFHATIDTASGRIDYADAGHGLSVIVRLDGTTERLEATGLPIGIVPAGEWTRGRAALEPGDRLVTFTDGVLDLFDGTLASLEEVAAIVRSAATPHEAVAGFAELAAAATPPAHAASDDVTVVVIARRLSPTAAR